MPKNRKVVWIEDDTDVIYPVVEPLRRAGFEILEYPSYSEALTHFHELLHCDLILLDLILPPGKSEIVGRYLGLELLRGLRQENVVAPVVIFSVVAYTLEIDPDELKALNATLLSKPVRPSVLKEHVYTRLGLSNEEA